MDEPLLLPTQQKVNKTAIILNKKANFETPAFIRIKNNLENNNEKNNNNDNNNNNDKNNDVMSNNIEIFNFDNYIPGPIQLPASSAKRKKLIISQPENKNKNVSVITASVARKFLFDDIKNYKKEIKEINERKYSFQFQNEFQPIINFQKKNDVTFNLDNIDIGSKSFFYDEKIDENLPVTLNDTINLNDTNNTNNTKKINESNILNNVNNLNNQNNSVNTSNLNNLSTVNDSITTNNLNCLY